MKHTLVTIALAEKEIPLKHQTAALFLVFAVFASAVSAQVCTGVGYNPAQFAGKPDPWPNNQPLPNDQLYAAYFARYGQHPGNPSPEGKFVPGYFDELDFVSYGALQNAGNASAAGPGGETLHPGCPTTTEQTDFAFAVPKGSPYVFTWYVSLQEGGTAAKPSIQHDPSKPCGPSSVPKSFLSFWPTYFNNLAPCGGGGPICGDGHLDPGETCQTCPADAGPCKPDPCPQLAAIPDAAKKDCANLLKALKRGTGVRTAVADVCRIITGAVAYQPKP